MNTNKLITLFPLLLLCGCQMNCPPEHRVKWVESAQMDEKSHKLKRMPDKCPGWNEDMNNYIPTYGEEQFGCVNAHNTAVMVQDPKDLIRGKKTSTKDSTAAVRAITDYQASKVKELKSAKSDTTTSSS